MESTNKVNPPCSSDAAACNPAAPVRPSVADPDPTPKVDRSENKTWPRFLVAKSRDDKYITKHNIFVVSKAIKGITGENV